MLQALRTRKRFRTVVGDVKGTDNFELRVLKEGINEFKVGAPYAPPLFKYLKHKYFWYLAIILFGCCLSNHYERTENFAFGGKIVRF